ncbi:spermidine/putrescine transport system substrate-binding protein [Microbacterium terrae]|uniref:Spermidine/putrescine-binding periplasmic protein n=1 Tax=Microbacterium terrae TaxID=69369 RepID=A0A0M2H4F6_9MICO|nr:extracellular solute-binding protein [Microbacterium terrae]KJL39336.1 Spermidine/putrescine-binding periplasmic protein precursor [Microbacterium terrae]MBP1078376.1 spermidine/putrescine transport system substrate-binding protein [Microbacterium terrae]GLJ97856.1 ABC transporter substrate-binding protein [Microbacterium terrae]
MTESRNPLRILVPESAAPRIARDLSRRGFLSLAALAGGTAVLAACAPGGGSTPEAQADGGELEDSLSVYTWGDYDSPDVVSSFTSELGPKVTLDSYSSNEELIAKLIAAKGTSGYDIVVPTGVFIPQMIENGLLTKFNKDLLPNLANMDPTALGRAWDPSNDYSVCKAWGTTGYVYDKTVITRELTTWADFFDAAQNEASGKTSMSDDPAGIIGSYFWANDTDWNTTDPDELEACRAFLVDEIAPHISAFDSYPGTNAIPQGTQVLMQAWNGDARLGILESSDPDRWQWVLPGPQTELWMDNWAIAAGAPHPEAAHAFINHSMTPENLYLNLDYIGYNVGGADMQQAATDNGLELPELIFFSEDQLAAMHEQELNDSQTVRVDIWTEMKAAAGA